MSARACTGSSTCLVAAGPQGSLTRQRSDGDDMEFDLPLDIPGLAGSGFMRSSHAGGSLRFGVRCVGPLRRANLHGCLERFFVGSGVVVVRKKLKLKVEW